MRASAERERVEGDQRDAVGFRLYRGRVLKSRDGIPKPAMPPPGTDMKAEARTARSRAYPVTVAYSAYAVVMIALGLRAEARTAALSVAGGVAFWTLIEYLVHRHVLHGRFPDGPGFVRHTLHRVFDRSHGDHHLRPWAGRHINGGLETVPFAILSIAASR